MRGTSKSTSYIRLDSNSVAERGRLCVLLTWLSGRPKTKNDIKTSVRPGRGCLCILGRNAQTPTPTHPTPSLSEAAVAVGSLENNSGYSLAGIGWGSSEKRQSCCNIPILLLTRRTRLLTPKHPDRKQPALEKSPRTVLLIVPNNFWEGGFIY